MKLTTDLILACGFIQMGDAFVFNRYDKSNAGTPSAHRVNMAVIVGKHENPLYEKFYCDTTSNIINAVHVETLTDLLTVMREESFKEGRWSLANSVFDSLEKEGFGNG